MSNLKHVATAIEHGEAFVGEALDVGQDDLADRLDQSTRALTEALEDTIDRFDLVPAAKEGRQLASKSLEAIYKDLTCQLETFLSAPEVSRLTPVTNTDIAERARFRLRRMTHCEDHRIVEIRKRLEDAVASYEVAVDAYLLTSTEAAARRDQAIAASQLFRIELERAKRKLLTIVEPKSPAYKRIRRRKVRTKPARWIRNAKGAQSLLEGYESKKAPLAARNS